MKKLLRATVSGVCHKHADTLQASIGAVFSGDAKVMRSNKEDVRLAGGCRVQSRGRVAVQAAFSWLYLDRAFVSEEFPCLFFEEE